MCSTVTTPSGEDLETPRELSDCLGTELVADKHYPNPDPDSCLCQIDLPASLKAAGVEYEFEDGDPTRVLLKTSAQCN